MTWLQKMNVQFSYFTPHGQIHNARIVYNRWTPLNRKLIEIEQINTWGQSKVYHPVVHPFSQPCVQLNPLAQLHSMTCFINEGSDLAPGSNKATRLTLSGQVRGPDQVTNVGKCQCHPLKPPLLGPSKVSQFGTCHVRSVSLEQVKRGQRAKQGHLHWQRQFRHSDRIWTGKEYNTIIQNFSYFRYETRFVPSIT